MKRKGVDDRGEYQALYSRLFDEPAFQQLRGESRLVLLTLKSMLGKVGILAIAGLEGALVERTGWTAATVGRCLEELVGAGWIVVERSVVWLISGLGEAHNLDQKNGKHRLYVQRHLASLPRLAIVEQFRARYRPWLDDETHSDGYTDGYPHPIPMGMGMPSETHTDSHPHTHRDQTETLTVTETETQTETKTETPPEEVRPPNGIPDPIVYLRRCVIALNAGLAANPLLAGQVRQVSTSEQQGTITWDRDGIPIALAEATVREEAARYRPRPNNRQPRSLKYFDAAVRRAHELATEAAGPGPASTGPKAKAGTLPPLREVTL